MQDLQVIHFINFLIHNFNFIFQGFGQNGPYAAMAGHDINYVAISGK